MISTCDVETPTDGARVRSEGPWVSKMIVVQLGNGSVLGLSHAFSLRALRSPPISTRCATEAPASSDYDGPDGGSSPKDTRIHWGSSNEGWLGTGGSSTDFSSWNACDSKDSDSVSAWRQVQNDSFMGLLIQSADSHYRYLGLAPDADTEEIKAAYRKLSKAYHPDTTSLPLEIAAQKFVRLKEAYSVLSSEQERRFYDWQLAQNVSKRQGGRFVLPYEASMDMKRDGIDSTSSQVWDPDDNSNEPVDRLGGANMELSDQAQAALAFDAFALVVSICAIVFALLKQSQSQL